MAEVHKHGNLFEAEIINTLTGKSKEEYQKLMEGGYTSSFDMAKGIGGSDKNYSIKATGSGSIGCGDILRFFKHCRDTDFTMIVGVWKQINPTPHHCLSCRHGWPGDARHERGGVQIHP